MSLGMFREPELIQRTLNMSLTEQVRTQDAPNLVAVIAESVAGRSAGWSFIRKNWKQITERFTKHQMPAVVGALSSQISSEALEQVREFFKENPLPEASQKVAKTIENIEINVAFRERSGAALAEWLAANAPKVKAFKL